MSIGYITTDLDLESAEPLGLIVEALGEEVVVLHHGTVGRGRYRASFEVAGLSEDVDATVSRFCALIESFLEADKAVWNRCSRRVFDIAFESGEQPLSFHSELRAGTVKRVAALGASIVITIYPVGAYDH